MRVFAFCLTKGILAALVAGLLVVVSGCASKDAATPDASAATAGSSSSSSVSSSSSSSVGTSSSSSSSSSSVGTGSSSSSSSSASSSSSSRSSSSSSSASSGSSSSASSISTAGTWEDVSLPITGIEPNQNGTAVVAAVPGQGKLIALSGLANTGWGKIMVFSSTDKGSHWTLLNSTGAGGGIGSLSTALYFSPDNANSFYVTGGYYKTDNGGVSFIGGERVSDVYADVLAIEDPTHSSNSNLLDKGAESVSASADGNTVLIGPHEAYQLFKSVNRGANWTNIWTNLGAAPNTIAYPTYPLVLDANTYLVGASFTVNGTWNTGGGTTGIYRTEDGGQTWTLVSNSTVVGSPLILNGKIYWSFFNGSDGGILTSADNGKTWTVATNNSLNYWVPPVALPNGSIAVLLSSGAVATSTNGAPPWTTVGPPAGLSNLRGMVYDPVNKAFIVWQRNGGIQRLSVN